MKDDTVMTYDYTLHGYVLTPTGVKEELGEDLSMLLNADSDANPTTLPNRFLKQVSRSVYGYFKQKAGSNYSVIEYILAKDDRLRDDIKDALMSQVLYVLTNGFVNMQSGLNLASNTSLDLDKIRGETRVSQEVVIFAQTPLVDYGFCIGTITMLGRLREDIYRKGY